MDCIRIVTIIFTTRGMTRLVRAAVLPTAAIGHGLSLLKASQGPVFLSHISFIVSIAFAIKLDTSAETASVNLIERVAIALSTPERINRFGSLSLGESWAMLNGIRAYCEADGPIQWLEKDSRGLIGLPIWIDRKTTRGTFQRFSLTEQFSEDCFVSIVPPAAAKKPKNTKSKK